MQIGKPNENAVRPCVYCGEFADTDDHIPSRSLFTPQSRSNAKFTIVDSCYRCNNGFSKDEEFFRNYIVTFAEEHSEKAAVLFNSKMRRSIERRPGIGQGLLNNMALVNVFTPSGIYIGKRTKIEIPESELARMFNVLNKYVKGLASVAFGVLLPKDHMIRHIWTDESNPIFEDDNFIMKTIVWNKDNLDTFVYGYARIPNSFLSVWIFIFFEKIPILSFVFPENSSASKLAPQNTVRVNPNPFDL